MAFVNYKGSNNGQSFLLSGISNSSLSLQCTADEGALFPSTFPFLLTIEAYNTDTTPKVVKREIVKVTNRVDDVFTIVRSAGTCVQDDTATPRVQGTTAYGFDDGDRISLYITDEDIDDIKTEVARLETDKLDIADYQNGTKVYAATSTGNDSYEITLSPAIASYQTGQVFRFQADVGNTSSATLNVNGLGAKTIKKRHDVDLGTGDIEAGQIVTVAYDGTNFQMDSEIATIPTVDINGETTILAEGSDYFHFYDVSGSTNGKSPVAVLARILGLYGDGSDGDVTISGTVTLSSDMFYNNLTIPSGNTLNPNGYRVFVRGTLSGDGTIARNGNNGGNGSTSGGTAATTLNQGNLNAEIAAGAGASGASSPSNGNTGTGTASSPSLVNTTSAAGGAGGGAGGYTGGTSAGSSSTRGAKYNSIFTPTMLHPATGVVATALSYKSIAGSAGGGGGACSNSIGSGTTGGGGGAGGNGGLIWVAVYDWNFTGVVSATGGTGGNGGDSTIAGGSGGGGGGGGAGGNGGVLFRIYSIMTADATKTLTGGSGGSGGSGSAGGSSGSSGSTGATGSTISVVI